MIKVDNEKNRVYINRKEYVLLAQYDDEELGHVLKCCTLKFKDYRLFFLRQVNGEYEAITDEEVFGKLVDIYRTCI